MDKPLVQNAADETQVKEAKTKVKDAARVLTEAWANVIATEDGRLVLWEVMKFCGEDQNPMRDSDRMSFHNIGQQNVARFIKAMIMAARPRALIEMMEKAGESNNG